jgi:hypothetical protein
MPKLWIRFKQLHHLIWTHPNKSHRTAKWSSRHPSNVNWKCSLRFSKRLKHCSNAWKQIRSADMFCKHPPWDRSKVDRKMWQVQQIKWYLNLQVEFIRETNDEETDKSKLYFKSKTYTLLSKEDLTDHDVNESFQNQFVSSMNTSQEIPVGHLIKLSAWRFTQHNIVPSVGRIQSNSN